MDLFSKCIRPELVDFSSFYELEAAFNKVGMTSVQPIIAVDFTASNLTSGMKSYGQSMHRVNIKNPYLRVLNIVEPVLQQLNTDGVVPVFRFGCVKTQESQVFPLLDGHSVNFTSFKELKDAYKESAECVYLFGPTSFVPIIQKAVDYTIATQCREFVLLLILTDGDITDLELNKTAVVNASNYPIHICIAGLGDCKFDKMRKLKNAKGKRFDNFSFMNFTEAERHFASLENGHETLCVMLLQHLPECYENVRAAGILLDSE